MQATPDFIQHFPSKRDTWLVLVLWSGVGISVACVAPLVPQLSRTAAIVAIGVCAATALLCLWVLYGTYYDLGNELLWIYSGPFRFRVPVAQIESVVPTRNPLSSPACSLDRLRISWRGGHRIMISPEDKEGFLRALRERRPALKPHGHALRST